MFPGLLKTWLAPRRPASRRPAHRGRPLTLESLEERAQPSTFIVYGFGGSDVFGDGSAAAPFQSIQRAVNVAQSGDTIRVAGGVYHYNYFQDQYQQFFGTTAVVDVINKDLNILGSFSPADGFQTPNFAQTPSVIDGSIPGFGFNVRGVFLSANTPGGAALNMQNFFIQNGVGQSIPLRGGLSALNGYGGGMLAEVSSLYLTHVVFENDVAFGVSGPGQAGVGAGGGLGVFSATGTVALSNVTFFQDTAVGGNGGQVGAYGQGGGLFVSQSTVTGSDLAFGADLAQGGATGGSGVLNGQTGDGFGGGADFEQSTANLSSVLAVANKAKGGNAPQGAGGNGLGAALENELGNVTVTGSKFQNNTAVGGDGPANAAGVGSLGAGGAIDVTNGNFALDSSSVTGNTAQGGNGGALKPGPLGGGIHTVSTLGTRNNITLTNSTLAGNLAAFGGGQSEQAGGSGGGASFNGSNVTIAGSRFDNNAFGPASVNLQGEALAANSAAGLGSVVTITGTSITNHTNKMDLHAAAVHVFPGSSATFSGDTFSGNTQDTNAGGMPFPAGVLSFM
jgi:hypothetical protein